MKMIVCPNAAEFFSLASTFLARFEAKNSLIYRIEERLRSNPIEAAYAPPGTPKPFYAVFQGTDGTVAGAAVWYPPNGLLLSLEQAKLASPTEELSALALALQTWPNARAHPLPGITASKPVARAFAKAWRSCTGARAEERTKLGLFALTKVKFPLKPAPGHLRTPESRDVELLIRWCDAFTAETTHDANDSMRTIRTAMQENRIFVWESNGQPVAMASWNSMSPTGVRINLVYTPPQSRGKGFAGMCVAAMSQNLLDRGRKCCFLFTDLTNSVPNRLYPKLGYQKIDEFLEVRFSC